MVDDEEKSTTHQTYTIIATGYNKFPSQNEVHSPEIKVYPTLIDGTGIVNLSHNQNMDNVTVYDMAESY